MKKDRLYRAVFIFIGVLLWANFTFASTAISPAASWKEHFDLVNIIVGVLFMAVTGLIVRTINKIDRNQTILFERVQSLSKDFYIMEGEHRAMTGMHKNHQIEK